MVELWSKYDCSAVCKGNFLVYSTVIEVSINMLTFYLILFGCSTYHRQICHPTPPTLFHMDHIKCLLLT